VRPNAEKLRSEIVSLSDAKTWDAAHLEWSLARIEFAEEPEACLCGHFPIVELCYLHNRVNSNEALVGNVCVTRFFDLGSDLVFAGLRRVLADVTRPLNDAAIDFAVEQRWIDGWEENFLRDTARKRLPSPRQMAVRLRINTVVLARVRRGPR